MRIRTVVAAAYCDLIFLTKEAMGRLSEVYGELKARMQRFQRAGMARGKRAIKVPARAHRCPSWLQV